MEFQEKARSSDDGQALSISTHEPDRAQQSPGSRSRPGTPRWLVAAIAFAVVPSLILIDSAVALFRGWDPRSRLDRAVISLVGMMFVLIVALPLVPKGRAWLGRNWAPCVAIVVSSLAAWMVAELGAAIWLARMVPPFHLWRPGTFVVLDLRSGEPSPAFPGVEGPSRFTVNSQGVRGTEWPPRASANRILCVGGSTTECHYLDDRETWPSLLEQALNEGRAPGEHDYWVGNAGISGYSTIQHLQFLSQSNLINQVDAAVFLIGVNDFHMRWHWERSHLQPLWRRSRLVELARTALQGMRTQEISREDTKGDSYRERRLKRQTAPVLQELPDQTERIREYRERVGMMIDLCRARNVRPIFLTQPVLWDRNLSERGRAILWFGERENGAYLSVEALRDGMDRFNAALRQTCKERGVACVELTSMNGNESFFYDDCHFTEAGAREVARLVCKALRPSLAGRRERVARTKRGVP